METHNRLGLTTDAIILFLQSLPVGSQFGIIGFGSNDKTRWDCEMVNYDDISKEKAISNMEKMVDSYYGATELV